MLRSIERSRGTGPRATGTSRPGGLSYKEADAFSLFFLLMAMSRTSAKGLMNLPRNFKTLFLTMTKLSQQTMTNLSLYDIFDTGETCDKIAEKRTLPVKMAEKRCVFGKFLEKFPKLAFYVPIFKLAQFLQLHASVRGDPIKEVPVP